jgi:hypothetical protein
MALLPCHPLMEDRSTLSRTIRYSQINANRPRNMGAMRSHSSKILIPQREYHSIRSDGGARRDRLSL